MDMMGMNQSNLPMVIRKRGDFQIYPEETLNINKTKQHR
jgi:hypothetical protein